MNEEGIDEEKEMDEEYEEVTKDKISDKKGRFTFNGHS